MAQTADTMERIVALCRRRGFIFGSSEIYGGIGGFWDYGPLGTELKRNIKDAWWNDMVLRPPPGPNGMAFQMVGIDCSIIMNPKVWEASGHVGGFQDPMVDCKETKARYRADQLGVIYAWDVEEGSENTRAELHFAFVDGDEKSYQNAIKKAERFAKKLGWKVVSNPPVLPFLSGEFLGRIDFIVGPDTETPGTLTEPRQFNLMFESHAGALRDEASKVYLRPETAQGIFVNFPNVMNSTRVKIPFGIAQIGKAFRNEINPRNYTFRSREFEQMEIEFFCKPDTSMMWWEFWRDVRLRWYESLNIKSEKLHPRVQTKEELAHYSKACVDIEYLFPFSDKPQELEGVAHRGDYDLKQHGKFAKNDPNAFAVIDDETKQRYVPHVVEPSAGVDRFALAVITEAYTVDESRASPEFMKFHPRLAPIKAAVFPLVAKDGLPELAEPIHQELRKHFTCQYEAKQSIGKRYARMDEAGTPFCFTIDGRTKEDGTVTVRDRDDASQIRIDRSRCVQYLREKLGL